jgi:hypothetical protein
MLLTAALLTLGAAAGPAPALEREECPPHIQMKTLLDDLGIGENGALFVGKLYGECLPDPVRQSPSGLPYNPYDGGRLSSVVKASNGQAVATYVWYAEKIATLWELSRYETLGGPAGAKPLGVGSYTLEFFIEDRLIQRFPFTVSSVESADPYHPGTLLVLDGPWRDYAELYFPNPNRYTQLWVWLRDLNAPKPPRERRYDLRLLREKDGALLAEGGGSSSALRLEPRWLGYKLSFRPLSVPAGGSGEYHAAAALAADGSYRIELNVDGKAYARYRFEVSGGRLVRPKGEAEAAASAKQVLSNEPNHWSLKRLP